MNYSSEWLDILSEFSRRRKEGGKNNITKNSSTLRFVKEHNVSRFLFVIENSGHYYYTYLFFSKSHYSWKLYSMLIFLMFLRHLIKKEEKQNRLYCSLLLNLFEKNKKLCNEKSNPNCWNSELFSLYHSSPFFCNTRVNF